MEKQIIWLYADIYLDGWIGGSDQIGGDHG